MAHTECGYPGLLDRKNRSDMCPGGSRTLDFLRARRAPYPLGQAFRYAKGVCVCSNSRNDVPRVAQWYGTIAAHTRRRASVLVCRVPKCPTALNVRQILFFSKSVILVTKININSKISKYFKKIISEKYSESNLEKKLPDI